MIQVSLAVQWNRDQLFWRVQGDVCCTATNDSWDILSMEDFRWSSTLLPHPESKMCLPHWGRLLSRYVVSWSGYVYLYIYMYVVYIYNTYIYIQDYTGTHVCINVCTLMHVHPISLSRFSISIPGHLFCLQGLTSKSLELSRAERGPLGQKVEAVGRIVARMMGT